VGDPHGEAYRMDQRLAVVFAHGLATAVAAAAIAEQQPCRRLGIILLAVALPVYPQTVAGKGGRVAAESDLEPSVVASPIVKPLGHHDPFGPTGKVLIEGLLSRWAIDLAVAGQGPQARLLLGSDAPHRVASSPPWRLALGHRAQRRVPLRCCAAWQPLGALAPDAAQVREAPPHHAGAAGWPPCLLQRPGEVTRGSIGPQNGGAHRITGTAILKELLDVVDDLGLLGRSLFFPAAGASNPIPGGIMWHVLEVLEPMGHALRTATKQGDAIGEAAVPQLHGFHCRRAAPSLFRKTSQAMAHVFFNRRRISVLTMKRPPCSPLQSRPVPKTQ